MLTVDGGNNVVGISTGGFMGDLGGGLHIKTSDSGGSAVGNWDEIILENSGHVGMGFLAGTGSVIGLMFGDSDDNDIGYLKYDNSGEAMIFGVNAAERMRLSSDGSMAIGSTSTAYGLNVVNDTTNYVCQFENSSSGVIYGIKMNFKGNDPDGNTRHAYIFTGGTGGSEVARAIMYPDGDWVNHDNSYGSLSDEELNRILQMLTLNGMTSRHYE